MKPIQFDRYSYRVDGKPFYLYSGEFHYFRVPRKDWERRMALFKKAGGNCLATYVPWAIHEPDEGRFSFSERDCDDLVGFLQAAKRAGLYVIARPGPYQYSELLYAGLPPWLCDRYPELLARNIRGKTIAFFSVSYLHPLFLEKAQRWFDRVCPVLAAHTVSRGGPIAFLQVDNEMGGIHDWFGSLDYHPDTMGFGQVDGRYTRYLRGKYGDVEAVNRAYGIGADRVESVPPPLMSGAATAPEIRRRRDYFEFYRGIMAEYACTLAGWVRGHGIQVPIVHNSAAPAMNVWFQETVRSMGRNFLLGSDHYYNLDQTWAQNNPTPQYARNVFFSCEVLRLMGFPPTVFELPGGSLADWPPILPEDAEACYRTNVALGMKGHNFYIFTGGFNVPGTGSTADLYDYGAAIGARGEIRPLYRKQKELGDLLRRHPWLATAEREADCRIALQMDQICSHRYWSERGEWPLHDAGAWKFTLEGVLTSAFCGGLSPVFVDIEAEEWTSDRSTPVLVVSSSAMPRRRQERLVRFIEQGGRVLIAPVLPEMDESFEPCTILRDYLGAAPMRAVGRVPVRLNIGHVVNVFNNGEVYFPQSIPADCRVLGIDQLSVTPVCWQVTRGTGAATVLGFRWLHAMFGHATMLGNLLGDLGLVPKVACDNPNVWTSLRTSGRKSMLFLMNLHSAPAETRVRCRPAGLKTWVDLGRQRLPAMTVQCIPVFGKK